VDGILHQKLSSLLIGSGSEQGMLPVIAFGDLAVDGL
jgi:hypothetical protein